MPWIKQACGCGCSYDDFDLVLRTAACPIAEGAPVHTTARRDLSRASGSSASERFERHIRHLGCGAQHTKANGFEAELRVLRRVFRVALRICTRQFQPCEDDCCVGRGLHGKVRKRRTVRSVMASESIIASGTVPMSLPRSPDSQFGRHGRIASSNDVPQASLMFSPVLVPSSLLFCVEPIGDVHKDAAVAERLVLPEVATAPRAVAFAPPLADVQECISRSGHGAVIGEGGRIEGDELRRFFGQATAWPGPAPWHAGGQAAV